MELQANVKYGNGTAFYNIRKENPGIYLADLVHFEGDPQQSPPEQITLLRGMRYWTGSCDNEVLLHQIGKIIVDYLSRPSHGEQFGNFFKKM